MSTVVVAGLYTHETNLRVEGFPLPYYPACFPFHGVSATHAGVGLNVSLALSRLGHAVRLASLIGEDETGFALRSAMPGLGLDTRWLAESESATSQSVILVAPDGTRQIHCDLKSLQSCAYPAAQVSDLLEGADLAVVCNINFARPLLAEAHRRGIPIATDVHALGDFDDAYNHDFMAAADILFLSDEALPCGAERAIEALRRRFVPAVIVVGMGTRGALLSERGQPVQHVPAIAPRGVLNTVGAGDALFSAFVDQTLQGHAPLAALRRASLYAGIKVAYSGATQGLLDREAFAAELAARGD